MEDVVENLIIWFVKVMVVVVVIIGVEQVMFTVVRAVNLNLEIVKVLLDVLLLQILLVLLLQKEKHTLPLLPPPLLLPPLLLHQSILKEDVVKILEFHVNLVPVVVRMVGVDMAKISVVKDVKIHSEGVIISILYVKHLLLLQLPKNRQHLPYLLPKIYTSYLHVKDVVLAMVIRFVQADNVVMNMAIVVMKMKSVKVA
jgi:hypothetical protein